MAADSAASDIPPRSSPPATISVVVPTRGQGDLPGPLLAALAAQTLDRRHWTLHVVFDGAAPSSSIAARLAELRAVVVESNPRAGPGAARNRGAAGAEGDYLAFTEDDCVPASDWLSAVAARLARDPHLDVLEGATLLPDGRPVRRRHAARLTWLPTNLVVRRSFFQRIGGYCERYFDARTGLYFREDSDFGFTATEAGARVAFDPAPRVVHPREHRGWLDPLRWARRYEMDPLLAVRHPALFREEIEVLRWGPFRLRRPFVRACAGYVVALIACGAAAAIQEPGVAAWFGGVALSMALILWGKWGFAPTKFPAVLAVPPLLLASLARGRRRAREIERAEPGAPGEERGSPRR